MLATQTERTELVPLIDALHAACAPRRSWTSACRWPRPPGWPSTFPQVGEQLRQRYRVVLLDEYQDTGHAQRVALSSLFGGGVDDDLALTAVGDPIQSIYGWRGASATNLPRFTTDFPHADGTPAPTLELRTSWRNPPRALHLANAVSTEARRRSVAVRELLPRPDAAAGHHPMRTADRRGGRTGLGRRPFGADLPRGPATGPPSPTAAVLVRRNADAAPMADALTARGVPVEVVGLAGSARRARGRRRGGDAAAGGRPHRGRGRDAGAHRAALAARRPRRRRAVAARRRTRRLRPCARPRTADEIVAGRRPTPTRRAWPTRSAIPGPPAAYSAAGHRRIVALGRELTALRAQLHHPLPDLVAEVRRMLGVDAEVRAAQAVSAGWAGTEHLDAFADVVADFAARPGGDGAGPAGVPRRRRGGRERAGARRARRRQRPGADPDRARRQGIGVAGRRGAAPEWPGVPVDGVDAHLADRCRRPAAAAAR